MGTFAENFAMQFTMPQIVELCIRILVSCVLGVLIGLERTRRFKEAGTRTHMIVCCASALFMIVSKYAFADLPMDALGTKGADSARIASQVVSGISFLCAGVIIRVGGTIKGLTTAAGLWITAAIGLAVGGGMYVIAGFATVTVMVSQYLLHKVTFGNDAVVNNQVVMTVREPFHFEEAMKPLLEEVKGKVELSQVTHSREDATYRFTIRCKKAIPSETWQRFIHDTEDVLTVEHTPIS